MDIQKKREFLINIAYMSVVGLGIYLAFKFLLPISVPFIIGICVALIVVKLSNLLRCPHRLVRLGLTAVIYGIIGLVITFLTAKGISAVGDIIKWLPELYEHKLYPFVSFCYDWFYEAISHFDPAVLNALESLQEGVVSALKNLIASLSGGAVRTVSGLATGVPSLILSMLAMIFSTVFVVADFERIVAFAKENIPERYQVVLGKVRFYLTDTLFVVIRSYVLIMLMTFVELSVLFTVFGIQNSVVKAAAIAVFDIMPILGTGGIMIPWAIISLALGYTRLGIELFIIYGIVTVVRNYMEPKIVGTQLGLHPIISLTSMFIGLRLFGFWGLFGLPVSISFFWKQKLERDAQKGAAVTE